MRDIIGCNCLLKVAINLTKLVKYQPTIPLRGFEMVNRHEALLVGKVKLVVKLGL